jgi:hypothetical protein
MLSIKSIGEYRNVRVDHIDFVVLCAASGHTEEDYAGFMGNIKVLSINLFQTESKNIQLYFGYL